MPDDKSAPKPAMAKQRGPNINSMFVMNPNAFKTWAHGMSKLSEEMAKFMQMRLQEEAAMWEKLASCRDPVDLIECQSQFAAKTGTDYTEAAQKLSHLMLEFANNYGSDLLRSPTDTD